MLFFLKTMSLIEGIGDEVTQFFIILLAGVIAYAAWWSTSTSEPRQVRTVVLLDRRRPARSIVRIGIPRYRRLTNYTETVTITAGNSSNNSTSVQTEASNSTTATVSTDSSSNTSTAEQKTDIASASSSGLQETLVDTESNESNQTSGDIENSPGEIQDPEERDIIETMDADAQNELRQRRLAHFKSPTSSSNAGDSAANETVCPEASVKNGNLEDSIQVEQQSNSEHKEKSSDNITIKLKYINDDIRVVDGRLEELLGDFKMRHFQEEINTNKEVKLIFNGHVLKQNQNSLQSCGLFDNCVVHCLIHQKRPTLDDRDRRQGSLNESGPQFFRNNNFPHIVNVNNNNQGIDWDLGNFLFAVVSFILLTAWYFRYVYAHLYTVTATVGLIIITVIFSIILVGAYLPNDDYEHRDTNLRIRVSRTERVEVQQQQ